MKAKMLLEDGDQKSMNVGGPLVRRRQGPRFSRHLGEWPRQNGGGSHSFPILTGKILSYCLYHSVTLDVIGSKNLREPLIQDPTLCPHLLEPSRCSSYVKESLLFSMRGWGLPACHAHIPASFSVLLQFARTNVKTLLESQPPSIGTSKGDRFYIIQNTLHFPRVTMGRPKSDRYKLAWTYTAA